ncbi:MAG TPA: response regulator [Polyangia bacterium]|nr:response regulator [Polyangia bacterium]
MSTERQLLERVRAAAQLAASLGDPASAVQLASRACSLGRTVLGADAAALFLAGFAQDADAPPTPAIPGDDRPRRLAAEGFALLPPDDLFASHEPAELERVRAWARSVGFRRVELAPIALDHCPAGALVLCSVADGPTLAPEDLDVLGAALAAAFAARRSTSELRDAYGLRTREQDQVVRGERMRALGAMALGIAHDFNNVLNGILAQTGVLAELARGQPPLEDALARLRKSALEGAATVERVQEFSRQRRDQSFAPIELDALVAALAAELRARAPAGVEIRTELAPGAAIFGAAGELGQTVSALLENAVEALGTTGGIITVTLALDADGEDWVLVVSDTGHGLTRDVRRRAFDPFFTTRGSRKKGLGLALAYGVVRRHGGRIDLDGAPQKGARARVRLPRLIPVAAADLAARESPPPRTTDGPPRVLLVEDDPDNRDAMSSLLQLSGYQVTVADSGAAGVAAFSAGAFDLVLTDLGLPDLNGWQVAGSVKAKAPSTPVALITGWGFNLDRDEIRRRGVDLLIKKPIDPQRFLKELSTLVGQGARRPSA